MRYARHIYDTAPGRILRICLAILLSVSLSVGMVSEHATYAADETSYQQNLEAARELKARYEAVKSQSEALLEEYAVRCDSLEEYITTLDAQMSEIAERLFTLKAQIDQAEAELAELQPRLDEARAREREQYEVMCSRVKYIYENGEITFLDVLLNAESLTDLIGQYEYMRAIHEYDNNLLLKYRELQAEVEERERYLIALVEKDMLLVQEAELERGTVETLMVLKAAEIELVQEQMQVTEEELFDSIEEISRQAQTISELEAEGEARYEAERAKKLAAAKAAQEAAAQSKSKAYDPTAIESVELTDETDPAKMIWPLPGDHRTYSKYGNRKAPIQGASTFHRGWDIGGEFGAPVVAVLAGTVSAAGYTASGGNYVKINHNGTLQTIYCHFTKLLVTKGEYVQQGQAIGLVGSTGVSTGPHVHFGVLIGGEYVDPAPYIAKLE